MKNALTVDLEDWFQVSNFDEIVPRTQWEEMPSRVERSTRILLDLFEETSARGTFFVLGWVAERHPGLVREVKDRGHDVASHGWGHDLVYRLTPEQFARDLDRSKEAIEAACGIVPCGYRAPSFSIDHRSYWALDVLIDKGFTYDSSIYPVTHPRYGVPRFLRTPTRVRARSGRTLHEFPLTTRRLLGRNFGASGGGYLRMFPVSFLESAFRSMNETGEPACLYVHPWEVDVEQPRLPVKGLGRLTHYTNLSKTVDRLRHLLARFDFTTMAESLRSSPGLSGTVWEAPA